MPLCLWFFAPILISGISQAAVPKASLDTAGIHKLYIEGDFDHAIDVLETAMKAGMLSSHADSVFAYKHLGVMYTAKYETREIGKKYFYELLMIEPTARIMDMYASDMIYMIFKNIQEEVEITRVRTEKVTRPPPDTVRPPPRTGKRKTWPSWPYLTAAAVFTGAGIGVASYFLLDKDPRPGTNHVVD